MLIIGKCSMPSHTCRLNHIWNNRGSVIDSTILITGNYGLSISKTILKNDDESIGIIRIFTFVIVLVDRMLRQTSLRLWKTSINDCSSESNVINRRPPEAECEIYIMSEHVTLQSDKKSLFRCFKCNEARGYQFIVSKKIMLCQSVTWICKAEEQQLRSVKRHGVGLTIMVELSRHG